MSIAGSQLSTAGGSNVIFGNLAGQHVQITIHPQALNFLTPGTYHLLPPIYDHVYGALIPMVRSSSPSGGQGSSSQTGFGADAAMYGANATGFGANATGFGANATGFGANATGFGSNSQGVSDPAMLALSDRRIPGRNSIVVVTGFGELLPAVQAAGGATLTVTG